MAIDSRIIKTIVPEYTNRDGKVLGMWLMQYFDPETKKNISIKVICGEKKIKADGVIWYVPKGMSVKDFMNLKPFYKEFESLSANPPAIVAEAPAAQDEIIEDAPF